jgi:hypothetical protein
VGLGRSLEGSRRDRAHVYARAVITSYTTLPDSTEEVAVSREPALLSSRSSRALSRKWIAQVRPIGRVVGDDQVDQSGVSMSEI